MTSIRDTFIAEIDAYIERSGMTPTEFGLAVMRDGSFDERLKGGKDPRASTIDRVRRWMNERPLARRRRAEAARSAA